MQIPRLFRDTPDFVRQVPAMYNLEPSRRVRNLLDRTNLIQLHMIPAIDRRAVFSAFDKTDKGVRGVLRGIQSALFPKVAIGKVEELEILHCKALLDGVDEGSANCVIVVQASRDQVGETFYKFRGQSLDHRQIEYAPKIDRLEDLPFGISSDSLPVHRGHVGMEEDDPVEILVRLAAYGGQTKPFEEREAMLQPVESPRAALLNPHIEARQDEMPKVAHENFLQ